MSLRWCRNIDLLPIDYAFRPRLRDRLTLSRRTLLKETLDFRRRRFSLRYSLLVPAFSLPVAPPLLAGTASMLTGTLLYHGRNPEGSLPSQASVQRLAPLNFRRKDTRRVSCYALFKGWLLLSQPPGCLGIFTSFTT